MRAQLILFCLLTYFPLQSHPGALPSLFNLVAKDVYEPSEDGMDSNIGIVLSQKQFAEEILDDTKPIVVKFHGEHAGNENLSKTSWQKVASSLAPHVRFLSVDVAHQKVILAKMLGIVRNLALQSAPGQFSVAASPIHERLVALLRYFILASQAPDAIVPMALFFEKGHLILPRHLVYDDPKALYADVTEQLLENSLGERVSVVPFKKSGESTKEPASQADAPTMWHRLRSWAEQAAGYVFGFHYKTRINPLARRLGLLRVGNTRDRRL